jgi:hypothetical protein
VTVSSRRAAQNRALPVLAVVAALACPASARGGEIVGLLRSANDVPLAYGVVSAQRLALLSGEWLPDEPEEPRIVVEADRDGAFRLRDLAPGLYAVTLQAPGHTARRLRVDVPSSRMALPPIQLAPECYARARFVSAAGSPVQVDRVVGHSFDLRGTRLSQARDEWMPRAAGDDGTVLIGPLPLGITVLAIDLPGVARTRLPDVRVSGVPSIVDIGTVVVTRGADLHVRVVDASGAPRQGALVKVADTSALSLLRVLPRRTDAEGLATFEGLARGTYRVTSDGDFPCGRETPEVERIVDLPAAGTRHERLVVGGAAVTLHAVREGAPLAGVTVILEPVRAKPRWPDWWPSSSRAGHDQARYVAVRMSLCRGSTDGEGELTLPNVPFGPTRVTVLLPSAAWSTTASVPIGGRSMRVDIPGEAISLRVSRGDTGAPVPQADAGWESARGTVRAIATHTGDVLLDGVARGPGRLTITADGFGRFERDLHERPDMTMDVRLTPEPPPYAVVRVADVDGAPIPNAIVYVDLQDGAADDEVAATGPDGMMRFDVVRPGAVRVTAWADGYASASTTTSPNGAGADPTIAVVLRRVLKE